ncbi:MAG: hypothetical protein H6839_09730 [Planctomycetes bacterium]|nr:hypothetical protein [Planctomycetota bacterium]
MHRQLVLALAAVALLFAPLAVTHVDARKVGPVLVKDDPSEAFETFNSMLPLVVNGDDAGNAAVREALDDKSPWIVIGAVEAVRQGEVSKSGKGKVYLPEVLALMDEKHKKLHKEEIVTVNVIACLGALAVVDTPQALQVVQAIVDWQKWSENEVVRLRHMAEKVLFDLTGDDCTLKAETVGFWEWWIRNKANAQPDKAPEKKSKTAPILFKEPAVGTRICFVIDVSDSMKWPINEEDLPKIKKLTPHLDWAKMPEPCSAMDLAKAELMHSIDALKPGAENADEKDGKSTKWSKNDPERRYFSIITYSQEVVNFSGGWIEASEKNCNIWKAKVEELEPDSYTNIHGAILMAMGLHDKGVKTDNLELDKECVLTGAHTIVFLTDGYATWSNDSTDRTAQDQFGNPVGNGEYISREKLVELAVRLNRFRKVVINTVGIGNHDKELMRDLAKQTGGSYQNWYCRIVYK